MPHPHRAGGLGEGSLDSESGGAGGRPRRGHVMLYRTLAAILLVPLLALPAWADEPTKEEIATAQAQLEEAFEIGDDGVLVEVIDMTAGIADPGVIRLVEKAFQTKSPVVIEAALRALGRTKHEQALEALHRLYLRVYKKKLEGNEDLFALLIKEMGRHGDESSVDLMTKSVFSNLTYDVGVARIMGLGNIRSPQAVEGLLKLFRQAGGRGRGAGVASDLRGVFRKASRVAMATLTGADQGEVPADWETWWRDNKKQFDMLEARPPVAEDVSTYWEGYWGIPYYKDGDQPAPPTMRSPITRIENPSKEQVEEAADGIREAFKTKSEDVIVVALERWGGVLDKRVVHELAAGMRSRDRGTKMMAIEVLGWTKYGPALKQLHREFRRSKTKWTKDEDMFAELLQAIGRHGDKSSVKVLSKSPFKALTLATGRARILGLANVRDKSAVEALIKGTQLAGDNPPRSWRPMGDKRFTKEFRIALTILTGEEMGQELEAWRQWWRTNKRTFKMSPTRPEIPDWMRKTWDEYWNEPYYDF